MAPGVYVCASIACTALVCGSGAALDLAGQAALLPCPYLFYCWVWRDAFPPWK